MFRCFLLVSTFWNRFFSSTNFLKIPVLKRSSVKIRFDGNIDDEFEKILKMYRALSEISLQSNVKSRPTAQTCVLFSGFPVAFSPVLRFDVVSFNFSIFVVNCAPFERKTISDCCFFSVWNLFQFFRFIAFKHLATTENVAAPLSFWFLKWSYAMEWFSSRDIVQSWSKAFAVDRENSYTYTIVLGIKV